MRITPAVVGTSLLVLCAASTAPAAISDPGFTEAPFVSSSELATATGLAWAPDGSNRLFITKKQGEVRIIKAGALLPTPFATVSPLYTNSECGVIGIAFDPNFLANQYVYVFVTVSSSEQQIIRYTVSGDIGVGKTPIVTGLPTKGANHDGGAVGFGPDGKLYWAIGDQGDGTGVDGDLSSMAAKVGRANLDGTVPDDNPFFDGAGPNADYIWARGFRNPYTLAFQPSTGLLWLNVVGTNYEQIFIVRRGDHGGWNNYENDQPAGFITPVIKYRTNVSDPQTIRPVAMNGAVRAGGVATYSTTSAHGFRVGEKITIAGVTDASFNTTLFVTSVPSTTSFAAPQVGADAQSGAGTATPLNQGGAVVGGAFYDATQFPAAYRGNFFYGDYNSGRIMRATIDATTNVVTSVDTFASGIAGMIDVAVGPDGALYYVGVTSNAVYRGSYNAVLQGLVVSPTTLWATEGQSAVFSVRLAVAPAADVSVTVARTAGDSDIVINSGSALTFTAANWNIPQTVTVAALSDGDMIDDTSTLSVSSAALATESVSVRARDVGAVGLVISQAALTITEGGAGTFTVALSSAPAADVTVNVAKSAGDDSVLVTGGAALTFTPANWSVAQTVTVAAAEDANATDGAATVSIVSTGLVTRTVAVTARDNDTAAPAITSTAITTAAVGAAYRYDVEATGLPTPSFSLDTTVAGMTIASSTGIISWTPSAPGSFPVVVRAANGVTPDATQSFTVVVTADQPPTCVLTRPTAGEVVSGMTAEFFGDGMDDVGTVRAEFFVDGSLRSTDVGTQGHYHFGGSHNLWNTTTLADGSHTVRFVIVDTAGQTCNREVTVTVTNGAPDAGADAPAEAAAEAPVEAVAEAPAETAAEAAAETAVDSPSAVDVGGDSPVSDGAVEVVATDSSGSADAATETENGDAVLDAKSEGGAEDAPVADTGARPDSAVVDAGAVDMRKDGTSGAKASSSGCGCDLGSDGPPSGSIGVLLIVAAVLGGVRRRRGRTNAVR